MPYFKQWVGLGKGNLPLISRRILKKFPPGLAGSRAAVLDRADGQK